MFRYYDHIQSRFWRFSPSARMVLAKIAWHAQPDGGGAYPGVEKLAFESCLSVRTVKTYLKALIEGGWIDCAVWLVDDHNRLVRPVEGGTGRRRLLVYRINAAKIEAELELTGQVQPELNAPLLDKNAKRPSWMARRAIGCKIDTAPDLSGAKSTPRSDEIGCKTDTLSGAKSTPSKYHREIQARAPAPARAPARESYAGDAEASGEPKTGSSEWRLRERSDPSICAAARAVVAELRDDEVAKTALARAVVDWPQGADAPRLRVAYGLDLSRIENRHGRTRFFERTGVRLGPELASEPVARRNLELALVIDELSEVA